MGEDLTVKNRRWGLPNFFSSHNQAEIWRRSAQLFNISTRLRPITENTIERKRAKHKHNSHSILHHAPASSSSSRHLLLNFEVDQDLTPLESILKLKNIIKYQRNKKKWKLDLICERWWWEV